MCEATSRSYVYSLSWPQLVARSSHTMTEDITLQKGLLLVFDVVVLSASLLLLFDLYQLCSFPYSSIQGPVYENS